ncbi:hypothetical protein OC834_004467 [Tilletia horrida]|nr:hypothetical protein OC834_004467 [Tilletia horrida]
MASTNGLAVLRTVQEGNGALKAAAGPALTASRLRRQVGRQHAVSYATGATPPPPAATTATGDPVVYMTDLLQRTDRTSYLISHFFPAKHHRTPYLALRAFNAELAQIRESVSNELLGRIRIGWWRDAVRALYAAVEHARDQQEGPSAGRPKKAPRIPAHPVLSALYASLTDPILRSMPTAGLLHSEHHLQALITAREDDLSTPVGPPTLDAVERYAERTASRLAYLELDLLGVRDAQMDEVSSHIGKARGLANLLASVPFHARMLRAPQALPTSRARSLTLPQEYLVARDVVEEEVYRMGADAPGLRDAVFDTATRANDYLISARSALARARFPSPTGIGGTTDKVPAVLFPALIGAVPAQDYLTRLEKANFDPFEPSLQQAGWRLSWALWRASRTGKF